MELLFYYTSVTVLFLALVNNMTKFVYCSQVVSLTKSLVWGPGLHVDVVLPVRYFFIQPVDTEGHKYVSIVVIAFIQCSVVIKHCRVVCMTDR